MTLISYLEKLDWQILYFFNGSDSPFLDAVAMTATSGLTWLPLYVALFYIVVKNNENMTQIFLIVLGAILCIFLADGLADYVAKPYIARWRPTHDPTFSHTVDVVNEYRETSYGFFSAHAANTFSIALFLSLVVKNRVLTIALVLWSLLCCWTRLYLGVHFPGDILVGLLWGGIVGVSVNFLYRKVYYRFSPKLNYVSSHYTSTGYSLSDIDVVLTALALVCCYIVIRAVIM